MALPFVSDVHHLDAHLRELSKVKFNQLDNLRDYLRLLNADKHLWTRSLRLPYINSFQLLDVSLSQRNEVVENHMRKLCEKGTELICKDFMNGLISVEQAEFVYSHEFLPLTNIQSL